MCKDIVTLEENTTIKACHVDAHITKSCATKEHQNKQQVDWAARVDIALVDLNWQHKGDLFLMLWAHQGDSPSGHQGRDATYRRTWDQGVVLAMNSIAQVIAG